MLRMLAMMPICVAVLVPCLAAAQNHGAVGIEQVPAPGAARTVVRVAPVDPSRSSATVQSAAAEKVSPETLAACRQARAQDRPAPKGVDCLKALQVPGSSDSPTAEISLLGMLAKNLDTGGTTSGTSTGSVSADDVARTLSSGDFQGTTSGTAAAGVARAATAPPPPSQR